MANAVLLLISIDWLSFSKAFGLVRCIESVGQVLALAHTCADTLAHPQNKQYIKPKLVGIVSYENTTKNQH